MGRQDHHPSRASSVAACTSPRARPTQLYHEYDRAVACSPDPGAFLLTTAPTLAAFTQAEQRGQHARAQQLHYQLQQAFADDMQAFAQGDPPGRRRQARRASPPAPRSQTCAECHADNAWVWVAADATSVCRVCGVVDRAIDKLVSTPDSRAAASYRRDGRERYDPVNYLRKLMRQVQTERFTAFDKAAVIAAVRVDLRKRGFTGTDLTPAETRHILYRLGHPELYGDRWYITKRINPDYRPVRFSHELEEQVVAIFVGIQKRFPRMLRLLRAGPRRHFLYYPMFLRSALHWLDQGALVSEFEPLKTLQRELVQLHWLNVMFQQLYNLCQHACQWKRTLSKAHIVQHHVLPQRTQRRRGSARPHV